MSDPQGTAESAVSNGPLGSSDTHNGPFGIGPAVLRNESLAKLGN
jgi:hypothetical protein